MAAAIPMHSEIVRFLPAHLRAIKLQPWQEMDAESMRQPGYADALSAMGEAYTVMLDGEPVACMGVVPLTPYRAQAWALISEAWTPTMRMVTRAALGWLQQTRYRRVEAVVSADFEAGHRWARMLGFEVEGGRRPAFMVDGSDGYTYARVRDGGTSIPSAVRFGHASGRPDWRRAHSRSPRV